MPKKAYIIGGGATGFFCAANLDASLYHITILEQNSEVLQKVRISGGGRCNVTHGCFDPRELVKFYPRGNRELISVFTRFQPGDTMEWFDNRDVSLKIEGDNRVFPVSDSSQTIINALLKETSGKGVEIKTKCTVKELIKEDEGFQIISTCGVFKADIVIFCTGNSPKSLALLEKLGHTIVPSVPSLFTFNIEDLLLAELPGTVFENAEVSIPELKIHENGPLLITHWGLSGPAILKISAWKARELFDLNYHFNLEVNFIGKTIFEAEEIFQEYRQNNPKRTIGQAKIFDVTSRFWKKILTLNAVNAEKQISQLNKNEISLILKSLCRKTFTVKGKSTYKDEFVTAGGVELKEVNFKNMSSKILSDLYIGGEVLNIDAVTGGFNFQACWSEAWLISQYLNEVGK